MRRRRVPGFVPGAKDGPHNQVNTSRRAGGKPMKLRVFAWPLAVFAALPSAHSAAQTTVLPTVESLPVPSAGDAADDAVVWVHPTNPGLSVVIGTDKDSGLAVYDLSGNQLQFLAH